MSDEYGAVTSEHQVERTALVAFVAGAVAFFTGSSILAVLGGTPPSETPLPSISAHLLWFLGVTFLAVGAVSLVLNGDSLTDGLAGYLSIGSLGLAVLLGLQWTTWAYVDSLAASHDQYDVFLDTVISPFGAGQALMYGHFMGVGVALLGWALRRTQLTHRAVAWAGVGAGTILAIATTVVLLAATKSALFVATILLFPLPYLWAVTLTFDIYRRRPTLLTVDDQQMSTQQRTG